MMIRNVFVIAKREIKSNFVTPLAYVILSGFLVLSGFFFFSLVQQYNELLPQAAMLQDEGNKPTLNEWVIVPYYQTLAVILIFLVPLLTMRLIAEERRSGTFELLLTSPIAPSEIVWGKFLGISFVVVAMLAFSASYPMILVFFADPEILPIAVGFLGIVLFSLAFAALGLASSTFTKSQTVSGVVSIVFLLLLFVIDTPAQKIGGTTAMVLNYLSPGSHLEQFTKGVLEGKDVVYFLSLIALGLFVSNRVLDAERWR